MVPLPLCTYVCFMTSDFLNPIVMVKHVVNS